jgi:hypothetical protein
MNIAAKIEEHGTTAIAEAMGLPISTIHTWKRANAIPGKGLLHRMKVEAFKAAIRRLKEEAASGKKRKAAA